MVPIFRISKYDLVGNFRWRVGHLGKVRRIDNRPTAAIARDSVGRTRGSAPPICVPLGWQPAPYCTGKVAWPDVTPPTVMVTGTALPGVTLCGTVTLIW